MKYFKVSGEGIDMVTADKVKAGLYEVLPKHHIDVDLKVVEVWEDVDPEVKEILKQQRDVGHL